MTDLNLAALKISAKDYLGEISGAPVPELFGVTDGKAVGTYVEHNFNAYLRERYTYTAGNAASGIDFPDINVDLKVTSIRQPQSSSPFTDASQKVFGLGYSLLVFVYEKVDDQTNRTSSLNFLRAIFIDADRTADYQTTTGLQRILDNEGNADDVVAFLEERNLYLDDMGRQRLAERILSERPKTGYLTVSNALQWRLQFGRVVSLTADTTSVLDGIYNLLA